MSSTNEQPENNLPPKEPSPDSESVQKLFKELFGVNSVTDAIKLAMVMRAKHLGQEIESPKPDGWSSNSNVPYFKERYALEIKATVDVVWATKKTAMFFYEDDSRYVLNPTCEAERRLNKSIVNSTYQRLNQGFLYLIQQMEEKTEEFPDGKYKTLREKIIISKEENKSGTVVRLKSAIEIKPLNPRFVEESVSNAAPNRIINEVKDFLEKAKPGSKKKWDGLALTPDEISIIEDMLLPLSEVVLSSIKPHQIMLMRKPDEDVAQ